MKKKIVSLIKRFTWLDWLLLLLLLVFISYLAVISTSRLWRRPVPVEFLAGSDRGVVAEQDKVWIDISGSVVSPGVYQLRADARIKDALVAAGGFSGDADREYVARELNLAAKVTDGQKIFVPKKEVLGVVKDAKININTASADSLMNLSGIGESRAAEIIKGRPYVKVDDLVTKKIISASVFEKIRDLITVY